MAFFGLTALGPQNCFEYAARTSAHIFIFLDDDFKAAWKKVMKGNNVQASDEEMARIFKVLYRGPVPITDKELIAGEFSYVQAPYSFDTFMSIMIQLRDKIEAAQHQIREGPGPSCDFRDSSELQSAIRKNKSSERSIHDKQALPLTASQEVNPNL